MQIRYRACLPAVVLPALLYTYTTMNKQAQRVTGRAAPEGFSRDAAMGYACMLFLVGKLGADLPNGARTRKRWG